MTDQEKEPLLSVADISEAKGRVCRYRIYFKGTPLLDFVADKNGVIAEDIGNGIRSIGAYGWVYNGQIKIDGTKPFLYLRFIKADSRGTTYAVEFMGAEIYNITATRKGFARGGHSHPYNVDFIMVAGSGVWGIRRGGRWVTVEQSAGTEHVKVNANEPHYIVAKEDMVTTEFPEGNMMYADVKDEESRRIVDSINESRERQGS